MPSVVVTIDRPGTGRGLLDGVCATLMFGESAMRDTQSAKKVRME
jgi:hypothetical protein